MRILVTGGAGFIGSHIVDHFVGLGHAVATMDDFSTGQSCNLEKSINKLKYNYVCSIVDLAECERVFSEFQPEVVYHLAALKSVTTSMERCDDFIKVNINGTKNLLDMSVKYGVKKFVFASTCAVYGDLPEKAKEDGRVNPISVYGLTKYAGEKLIEIYANETGLDTLIFRFSNVFGPRQAWNDAESAVIPKFIRQIHETGDVCIYGDGKQTRDFMYVKDLVYLVTHLAQCKLKDKVFNIATGDSISILELVELLEKLMRKEVDVFFDDARKGEIYKKKLDTFRMWKQFWYWMWKPTTFERALRETIEPIVSYKKPLTKNQK